MRTQLLIAVDGSAPDDRAWADALATKVEAQLARVADELRLVSDDLPRVTISTFAELPAPSTLDPLSIVLLVLPPPGRVLTTEERKAIEAFTRSASGAPERRVLPICREDPRYAAPQPLAPIVAFHLHDADDYGRLTALLTRALTMMGLRSSANPAVFISYRVADGKPLAEAIERQLLARGYDVWRDELHDRDGSPLIAPGTFAQETIRKNILDKGFVLLLDTPKASGSVWVREEVSTAIGFLLPILPIVVDSNLSGSRFRPLRELENDVHLGKEALEAATVEREVALHIDEVERAMRDLLLAHLRSRRRLIEQTRALFEDELNCQWREESAERLLYSAEMDIETAETPGLRLRLLIHCCPYVRVVPDVVRNLCTHFDDFDRDIPPRHQFGVVMHNASVDPTDYPELLREWSHVLLLNPNQVKNVFDIFGLIGGRPR